MAEAGEALDRRTTAFIVLVSLFVASLTASNFLASKLFQYKLFGLTLMAPAAVAAYALTFAFTDMISEVYGKRHANLVVRIGFATQILVLLYAWIALKLPVSENSPASQEAFASVVGSTSSIIAASLTAYLVSQHHDVWAFHFWRRLTGGRWLWLRNNASTLVSQLIDTVLFITLAFKVYPSVLGGPVLPWSIIQNIIVGQYLVKALIALADTPIVYAGVFLVKRYIHGPEPARRVPLGVVDLGGGGPGRLA